MKTESEGVVRVSAIVRYPTNALVRESVGRLIVSERVRYPTNILETTSLGVLTDSATERLLGV